MASRSRQIDLDVYSPILPHIWIQIEVGPTKDPMMKCKNCEIKCRKSRIGEMGRCPGKKE